MASQLVDILDPQTAGPFLAGSVRIPAHELGERVHELPSPKKVVRIAVGAGFEEASAWFLEKGRLFEPISGLCIQNNVEKNRLWSPPPFLEELDLGCPDKALSLGCGAGREAVWLAERGWQVTALDRLPDALELGRKLEARYPGKHPIDWQCIDLRKQALPQDLYGLVIQFLYLHKPLFPELESRMKVSGLLVMETFSPEHQSLHGKPEASMTLNLSTDIAGLERVYAQQHVEAERHTSRLVFRKKG
jgi:SAM-dependent methyltransferase